MLINFSKYSTIKVGGKIEVQIIDENNFRDGFIIGGASNTLISPTAKNLNILSDKYRYIQIENGYLKVGAKTRNRELFNFSKKNNLTGFEFLKKLPGTIGGSLKMNAGMKQYEISQNFVSLKTLNGYKEDINFDYRFSDIDYPIFEVVFKLKKGFQDSIEKECAIMRKNQPIKPSLGSVFKNPQNNYAGKLIEAVKLKGFKKGNMLFSNIHSNFLINLGNGNFEDSIFLIKLAQKRVFEEFGIKLEKEIIIL